MNYLHGTPSCHVINRGSSYQVVNIEEQTLATCPTLAQAIRTCDDITLRFGQVNLYKSKIQL